jgi:hypothetical protein
VSEPPGYVEFEFDLPGALLAKLIDVFDRLEPAPMTETALGLIPDAQGVYQLFNTRSAHSELVYIGKTDAAAGLRKRLTRHARKLEHRVGLSRGDVFFKAVRVYVFTAVDLEAQLIDHYGGVARVSWNGSGFGSNDPGRERDTTRYKADHFDARYPIETGLPLDLDLPPTATAAEILKRLKRALPYLLRFELAGGSRSRAHDDLETTLIIIDSTPPLTAENIIAQVVHQLPLGWHATALPSHTIMYKDDPRKFPSGREIARSRGI